MKKKNIKKLAAGLLALAFASTACGDSKGQEPAPEDTKTESDATEDIDAETDMNTVPYADPDADSEKSGGSSEPAGELTFSVADPDIYKSDEFSVTVTGMEIQEGRILLECSVESNPADSEDPEYMREQILWSCSAMEAYIGDKLIGKKGEEDVIDGIHVSFSRDNFGSGECQLNVYIENTDGGDVRELLREALEISVVFRYAYSVFVEEDDDYIYTPKVTIPITVSE